MKIIFFSLFIFPFTKISSNPICEENKNNCEKCHPLTNLCIICSQDNYIPDRNGGCIGTCTPGKNYCNECDKERKLCINCEKDYYPDKIGGCSYTINCDISYKGLCSKCIKNYVLIGQNDGIKLCKNKNSDDLKNCKNIDNKNGLCIGCNQGYFLNKGGDFRCIETENCGYSLFGKCVSCAEGYYLNKRNDKCEKIENSFFNCKSTIDEINCEICKEDYYIAKDGQCSETLKCSVTDKGKCKTCEDGYILLDNGSCAKELKCKFADKDTSLCDYCLEEYCLDQKDMSCVPNTEFNEYQNCFKYKNGCRQCIFGYALGDDLKCSTTNHCGKSYNGTCLECSKNYYLGYDHKCTGIEHCIYSGHNYELPCDECEDNYYLDFLYKVCTYVTDEKFKNCKVSSSMGYKCSSCKNNYYINQGDDLCYSNTDKNDDFYKCESSDFFGNKCEKCVENYFLNEGDKKCSKIENCKFSENEDICIECRDGYCLDLSKKQCIENDYIDDEKKKFYIACNITNEWGTACQECIDGYEVGENGYCIDNKRCEEKKDGNCIKCKNDDFDEGKNYCANEVFGCIGTVLQNCIRCDDILDLYSCTECEEGYEPNLYGVCYRVFN